jgi:hypothetical protein
MVGVHKFLAHVTCSHGRPQAATARCEAPAAAPRARVTPILPRFPIDIIMAVNRNLGTCDAAVGRIFTVPRDCRTVVSPWLPATIRFLPLISDGPALSIGLPRTPGVISAPAIGKQIPHSFHSVGTIPGYSHSQLIF